MTRTIVPTGTLADIEKGIATVEAALLEERKRYVYTNLHDANYDHAFCRHCGKIVLAGDGRLWKIHNIHRDYDLPITLCNPCHDEMVIEADELANEADYRDLKDTENCARPTL